MPKILIVEDEKDYREQIETILSWEGYEVRTAANGREAIDIGARFRPDVLVTDWMLRDHIHGLHVVGALRLVHGVFRAILITAFTSDDLKAEADTRRVFQFIEKPFDLDYFQEVIRAAIAAPAVESQTPPVAVIEVDRKGRLLHANAAALALFAETFGEASVRTLADVFPSDQTPELDAATGRWLAASPGCDNSRVWEFRSQRPGNVDTWLVALRPQAASSRANPQLLDMLLGVREGKLAQWPFDKRVLVVDDDQLQRQLAVAQMERAGAGCYAAESESETIRLFTQDEGIGLVILDYDMPGADPGRLATQLKTLRPSVRIVGNSGMNRQAEFARIGVAHFLFKPWTINHLIEAFST